VYNIVSNDIDVTPLGWYDIERSCKKVNILFQVGESYKNERILKKIYVAWNH